MVLQFRVAQVHVRDTTNVHSLKKQTFNILKNIQNTYLVPLIEENGTSYTYSMHRVVMNSPFSKHPVSYLENSAACLVG